MQIFPTSGLVPPIKLNIKILSPRHIENDDNEIYQFQVAACAVFDSFSHPSLTLSL